MVTVTIIIIFILIGLFIFRQLFKSKSGVASSKDKFPFMVQILIGIVLILLGLFLAFGITVYSLKEQDNNGFYGFSLRRVSASSFVREGGTRRAEDTAAEQTKIVISFADQ